MAGYYSRPAQLARQMLFSWNPLKIQMRNATRLGTVMRASMKSICCAVFSAVTVKMPVPQKPSFWATIMNFRLPIDGNRFIQKRCF